MSQFSTNESTSLEKRVELNSKCIKTTPNDINQKYELLKCADWIQKNDFKKVCLQFPDYLIVDSSECVKQLEGLIAHKVYILGDTAYESCCVDYTAAGHISADAIIHFGEKCFSKPENIIPCLKIFEKYPINIRKLCETITKQFTSVDVIINTPYLYKIDQIRTNLPENQFKIISVEDNIVNLGETVVYVGLNDRKLMNIALSLSDTEVYYFDTQIDELIKYEPDGKVLKRRLFLSEKIKDSSTVGVVISTLAVKNYLKVIDRLKTLIKIHGKKYYVISVGKPSVAKLANFPEVDIFVVIGCAMNQIYENRDYYKPIVTPFDLESSLNPTLKNPKFSFDFNSFLTSNSELTDEILKNFAQNDISLLTGNIRPQLSTVTENFDSLTDVALKSAGVLTTYGAGYLSNRSWKGLEGNLGGDEPRLAVKGRVGIAQGYQNENVNND